MPVEPQCAGPDPQAAPAAITASPWRSPAMAAPARGPTRTGCRPPPIPAACAARRSRSPRRQTPLIFWRKELRPDSGGAGRTRGGLGQIMEIGSGIDAPFDILAAFDRIDHPPRGRDGGRDGAAGYVGLKSGQTLRGKGFQIVPPGDRLVVHDAGRRRHRRPGRAASRKRRATTGRRAGLGRQTAITIYGLRGDGGGEHGAWVSTNRRGPMIHTTVHSRRVHRRVLARQRDLHPRAGGDGKLRSLDGLAGRQFPHQERQALRRGGQEATGGDGEITVKAGGSARLQGAGAAARRARRAGADGRHSQHPADRRRADARHRGHSVPGRHRRGAEGAAQVPAARVREDRRQEQPEDPLHGAVADAVPAPQGEGPTRSTA